MTRLRIITFISFFLSSWIFFSGAPLTTEEKGSPLPSQWLQNENPIYTTQQHIRGTDQTFLTYPEWFLVHSPKEQADYFARHTSTSFPYLGHIQQLWKSYAIVTKQIAADFEVNIGYHVMILVIAVSTTVEYAIKAFYEKFIGEVTNPSTNYLTEEDRFNAVVTREYVDFILQTPWYEFDFFSRLVTLWTDIPYTGNYMWRKIERRYYLSLDLAIKSIYGYIIKLATKSAYEEPLLNTSVIVEDYQELANAKIKSLGELESDKVALSLPRYDGFNGAINDLVKNDIKIKEIAGNNSVLLLTLLVPQKWNIQHEYAKTIFSQTILTNPSVKRVGVCVRVKGLNSVLRLLQEKGIQIEHVYDY
ncbi:MAG: hypothetical protein AAF518_12825 [Spirochaetota bacterium]